MLQLHYIGWSEDMISKTVLVFPIVFSTYTDGLCFVLNAASSSGHVGVHIIFLEYKVKWERSIVIFA